MNPADYGMDIPESKWTDYSGQAGSYKYVSPEKFDEIKAEHAKRDKNGIPQKERRKLTIILLIR